MKARRVPLRKCTACQEMIAKKELVRIVRSPEGDISVDPTGKKSGRGAYLCKRLECIQLAKQSRALERALKTTVPESVYEQLESDFVQSGITYNNRTDLNENES